MSKGVVTPEKIEKFDKIVPNLMQHLTIEANDKQAYFHCDWEVRYLQDYDLDVDKGVGAEADIDASGMTFEQAQAAASAKAGFQVEKSREGSLLHVMKGKSRSNKALEVTSV